MFYLRDLAAELRRRPGRTALSALGLAVGVRLVALHAGDKEVDDRLRRLTLVTAANACVVPSYGS